MPDEEFLFTTLDSIRRHRYSHEHRNFDGYRPYPVSMFEYALGYAESIDDRCDEVLSRRRPTNTEQAHSDGGCLLTSDSRSRIWVVDLVTDFALRMRRCLGLKRASGVSKHDDQGR